MCGGGGAKRLVGNHQGVGGGLGGETARRGNGFSCKTTRNHNEHQRKSRLRDFTVHNKIDTAFSDTAPFRPQSDLFTCDNSKYV